jgi:hypothetical protein
VLSGDHLIAGGSGDSQIGTEAGAAFIFHRTGENSWDNGTKILAPDAQAYDRFGISVGLSGDYAVVGAYKEDELGSDAGAAYLLLRTGSNSWEAGVKVYAPDGQYSKDFGRSAAMDGVYTIIGSPQAAYVFF